MKKEFEITDDAGFLGLVNTALYQSYINEDWEFDQLKARIISESNKGHLLFWGTDRPNIWMVRICDRPMASSSFKNFEGKIKVTNSKLYLINYESLASVAQFDDEQLPEPDLAHLYIPLENGLYHVTIYQLLNPETDEVDDGSLGFEIVLQKSNEKMSGLVNNFDELVWSQY